MAGTPHGDMNTPESSPSGTFTAAARGDHPATARRSWSNCSLQPKAERATPLWACAIWIRKSALIKESGVHVFTMRDIDERGMRDVMSEALRFVADDTDGTA